MGNLDKVVSISQLNSFTPVELSQPVTPAKKTFTPPTSFGTVESNKTYAIATETQPKLVSLYQKSINAPVAPRLSQSEQFHIKESIARQAVPVFDEEELKTNEMLMEVLLVLQKGKVPVAKLMFNKMIAERSELSFKFKTLLQVLHIESGEDDGLSFDDNISKTARALFAIIYNQSKPFSEAQARKEYANLQRILKN